MAPFSTPIGPFVFRLMLVWLDAVTAYGKECVPARSLSLAVNATSKIQEYCGSTCVRGEIQNFDGLNRLCLWFVSGKCLAVLESTSAGVPPCFPSWLRWPSGLAASYVSGAANTRRFRRLPAGSGHSKPTSRVTQILWVEGSLRRKTLWLVLIALMGGLPPSVSRSIKKAAIAGSL